MSCYNILSCSRSARKKIDRLLSVSDHVVWACVVSLRKQPPSFPASRGLSRRGREPPSFFEFNFGGKEQRYKIGRRHHWYMVSSWRGTPEKRAETAEKFHTNERHYPDLGNSFDWSYRVKNLFQTIRSTTQIWEVTGHQCGISALVPHTAMSPKCKD